jgi:hypothetical protein
VSWKDFLARRKIDVEKFLAYHNIKSRDEFVQHLKEIGVDQPSEQTIETLFPSPQPQIENKQEEKVVAAVIKERNLPQKKNNSI